MSEQQPERPHPEPPSMLIPPLWFAQRLSIQTGRRMSFLDPLTMLAWHQVNEIGRMSFRSISQT